MLSRKIKRILYKKRKRGQKNANRVYLRNKTGNLYVPRELRPELEELSAKVFKSKRKYTQLAYNHNMDIDGIKEEMVRAVGVMEKLTKQLEDEIEESKEERPEESVNESDTPEGSE